MTPTPNPTAERWRKKPVTVEARQFGGLMEIIDVEGLALWCGGTFKYDTKPGQEYKSYYWSIEIPTLGGVMRATPGDWIIRGVQGEFYPCKPDIFEQTYEPVGLLFEGAPSEEPQGVNLMRDLGFDESDPEVMKARADAAFEEQVERAARALAELEPGEDWPTNEALGGSMTGTRDDEYRAGVREDARRALVAAGVIPQPLDVDEGKLAEVIRVEMSRGSYRMTPNEKPYATSAALVTRAVVEYLRGER